MGAGGHRTKACTILSSGSGRYSSTGVSCSERGRQFPDPGTGMPPLARWSLTVCIARMMHRVLVESWEAEKAVEEAHKKVVEIYARHLRDKYCCD